MSSTTPTAKAGDETAAVESASKLGRQLLLVSSVRLLVLTSVLLPAAVLRLTTEGDSFDQAFLRLTAVVGYTVAFADLLALALMRRRFILHAYLQFGLDLLLITVLVYQSGGATSPFSIFYAVIIAVVAMLLPPRSGLSFAEAAWLLFAAVSFALFQGWLPSPVPGETVSAARLIYSLIVHLLGFYGVALLTSYLARSVARVEEQLQATTANLAELEAFHRDVIESMTSGLLTVNIDGQLVSLNPTGRQILGIDDRSVEGLEVAELGLFRMPWEDLVQRAATPSTSRAEIEIEIEGRVRNIGYNLSEISSSTGDLRGVLVLFQDLTAWRSLQKELQLKHKMAAVGELAAGLAHEIGNPLAAISGSVQMLSKSLQGPPAQRQLLQILLKESQRLDRTIKSFLSFARPTPQHLVLFDVAQLLGENVQLLSNSEEIMESHTIRAHFEPEHANIVADRDQISQVFWNLTRNALRAMPSGGVLRVSGFLSNGSYRINVEDTGQGMSEEERDQIFQPFRASFLKGVGLGMAIVYRIVEQHGGQIDVRSEPGHGTRVQVEIPTRASASNPIGV